MYVFIFKPNLFSGGMVSTRLSGVIFYANALMSLLLSSKFVHDWQNISASWLHIENAGGLNLPSDVKVKRRVILVSSLVASCAFSKFIFIIPNLIIRTITLLVTQRL